MRQTLIGMLAAVMFVLASPAYAADVTGHGPTATFAAPAKPVPWVCSASTRVSRGLLFDTAGFFGTKQWAASSFLGCAQPNGGFDFDVAGNTPFRDFDVANEFDVDAGYTFVFGKLRVRFGIGYWNFHPAPGPRFQIAEFQVKSSYTLLEADGFTLAAWARIEDQELFTGAMHLRDVNIGGGLNFTIPVGGVAKFVGEAAYYHHLKSFGPSQNVTALTLEMPFALPKGFAGLPPGVEVTTGPWWRGTWGNINGLPGNWDFNHSPGWKLAATW